MAAKQYVIDLGIDTAAGLEPREGFPILAGLVDATGSETGEGTAQWLTKFEPGDSIAFRIWNFTLQSGPTPEILSFMATLVAPTSPNHLLSPFENSPNPILCHGNRIFRADLTKVRSSVFPRARDGWLLEIDKPPLGRSYQIAETSSSIGRFFLRVKIELSLENIIRTYFWDPEIVVGGSGG